MKVLEGGTLVNALRGAVDGASKRLWIASPYIGGWPNNVRRILGTSWQENVPDVRLLTDVEAGGFRLSTMRQFLRRGEVRSLLGLHSKLYIADSFALLTSANLTGTAFSRRYETGIVLGRKDTRGTALLFEKWWGLGTPKTEEQLPVINATTPDPDHPGGPFLPALTHLPPDVEDAPLPGDAFGDYGVFLDAFHDLAARYASVQRIWKSAPLNFEVDGFLNFLYHYASGLPSRPYRDEKPRHLTSAQRDAEVRRFAEMFRLAYREGDTDESPTWRSEHGRDIRRLLRRNLQKGLNREEVRDLLTNLNSMKSYPVNVHKVLNPQNNSLGTIRETLRRLVDETVPVQRRMSEATGPVFGMSKAAVQELVGFYYGGKYPLRNANTNCGLRFFGYDVRVN